MESCTAHLMVPRAVANAIRWSREKCDTFYPDSQKSLRRQRNEDYNCESDTTPAVGGASLYGLQVYWSPVLAHKRISTGFLSSL